MQDVFVSEYCPKSFELFQNWETSADALDRLYIEREEKIELSEGGLRWSRAILNNRDFGNSKIQDGDSKTTIVLLKENYSRYLRVS